MSYILNSFAKFKSELLSKGFYDVFKGTVLFLIGLFSTYLVSFVPEIKSFLLTDHSLPTYIIVGFIFLVMCVVYILIINKLKLKALLDTNNIDELTGLKNHKALNTYLLNAIKETNMSIGVILMDIDDFKSFNSSYGYNKADLVLQNLGELLGNDKRVTDETFRFFNRGDEFLIVAKETNLSQAVQASERKRKMIEKNIFSIDESKHKLTVSCGVTILKKGDSVDSLIDRVSDALKIAKETIGKNNTKSIS